MLRCACLPAWQHLQHASIDSPRLPARLAACLSNCLPCIAPMAAHTQATHLIKYLQSMRGRRLWPCEDVAMDQQLMLPSAAALASIVQHCLQAFDFEPALQPAWVAVALEWALHARSRHLACRSQQVRRQRAHVASYLTACMQDVLTDSRGWVCGLSCIHAPATGLWLCHFGC